MKVSALMVTYNHAPYIAQAIESVMAQQTDFQVELIIGEDCSTDNTREIVSSYAQQYPNKIKAFLNQKNLGPAENFRSIYDSADCDYLALLEGDDYWTDPLKLNKQVNFLEQHRDFAISFHNVWIENQNSGMNSQMYYAEGSMKPQYTLQNLLGGNFIQTCSIVYRRENLPRLPDWLQTVPMGDWPLHILHAEKGLIGYIDEVMSVYRILNTGGWANKPAVFRLEKSITACRMIDQYLGYRYSSRLKTTSVKWYNILIDEYMKENNTLKAFDCMMEAVKLVDNSSVHADYLMKYVSVFINAVTELVQRGNLAEALSLYSDNIDSVPYVKEIRKLESLMNGLSKRLAGAKL